MMRGRAYLWWWLTGLAAFAIAIFLHSPLAIEAVPGGILDHQSAGTAEAVNAIQASWVEAGVYQRAVIAMASDIIFILIYGLGCVMAGQHFRSEGAGPVRVLGWVAMLGGVVFLVSDLGETASQMVQLTTLKGDDTLATLASGLRPIKVNAFIASTLAVLAGLVMQRFSAKSA